MKLIIWLLFVQWTHQSCELGTYWTGQTCESCLNQYCICNAYLTCDEVICPDGLMASGMTCIPCPKGCLSCQSREHLDGYLASPKPQVYVCQACDDGHQYYDGVCHSKDVRASTRGNILIPEAFVKPCKTLNVVTRTCQSCTLGQFLNEQHLCEECMLHCSHCPQRSHCDTCQDGYIWYLNATQSYVGCKACSELTSSDTPCLSCVRGVDQYTCEACFVGYTLIAQSCVACHSRNCLACAADPSQCQQCTERHYLDDDRICRPCGNGCLHCTTQTNCQSCLPGFASLNNATCLTCQQMVPWCLSCDQDFSCAACERGYYMSNGGCASCSMMNVSTCKQVNKVVLPITCIEGYYLVEERCLQSKLQCYVCTHHNTYYRHSPLQVNARTASLGSFSIRACNLVNVVNSPLRTIQGYQPASNVTTCSRE